jgi:hypothetical protein
MNPYILSEEEAIFIKKLCKPKPFKPTFPEIIMLELFKKFGIVKEHKDGAVEVTQHGADCYLMTMELRG